MKFNYDEEQQPSSSCPAIQGVGLVATPPGTPSSEEGGAPGAAAAAAASAESGPS